MLLLALSVGTAAALHAPVSHRPLRRVAITMAEGGPPQIDWQAARVMSNEPLARGTNQLRVQADAPTGYKAGHIIGFELSCDGEALKGPYTVTRAVGPYVFDIVYRIIPDGRKTPFMESLGEGDEVRFGGRFGTPVEAGIAAGAERVVGVATGAGIGPLVGYAEAALASADGPQCIELFCGFRDLADVCGSACD
eukprot:2016572-Prymnesium_polylepis.1